MEPEVGLRLAAQRLTALLGEPRYRRRWVRYSSARRGQPSRAAVAAVLAEHLFETGQVGWDHQPRSLENRVGRALNGQRLSDRTLELFIAAFAMTDQHADELRSLRSGHGPARQLVVAAELSGERPMPPRPWRILQLAEEHHVGADRSPRLHRTRQLMTPVERTDRYHYAFDTPHAAVTVRHGGAPVGAFRVAGSPIHVVEVALPRPLLPGAEHAPGVRDDVLLPRTAGAGVPPGGLRLRPAPGDDGALPPRGAAPGAAVGVLGVDRPGGARPRRAGRAGRRPGRRGRRPRRGPRPGLHLALVRPQPSW